jgi:hypothetical protein
MYTVWVETKKLSFDLFANLHCETLHLRPTYALDILIQFSHHDLPSSVIYLSLPPSQYSENL